MACEEENPFIGMEIVSVSGKYIEVFAVEHPAFDNVIGIIYRPVCLFRGER
jgi:hypothetical protein